MMWFYLLALLIGIGGLLLIDRRLKLAFWHDKKRTAITIGVGMALFIVWDLLGISFGIFFKGGSEFALPFSLLPEFPVEELFFLFLLCYTALLLYLGLSKWRRIS